MAISQGVWCTFGGRNGSLPPSLFFRTSFSFPLFPLPFSSLSSNFTIARPTCAGLQHMERQSMMAAGAVNMSKQQQDFMARAVDTAVKTMGADQRSFQKSVEAQLTQLRENLTGFNIEFSQLTVSERTRRRFSMFLFL